MILKCMLGNAVNLLAMSYIDVLSRRSWTACAGPGSSDADPSQMKTSEKWSIKLRMEEISVATFKPILVIVVPLVHLLLILLTQKKLKLINLEVE